MTFYVLKASIYHQSSERSSKWMTHTWSQMPESLGASFLNDLAVVDAVLSCINTNSETVKRVLRNIFLWGCCDDRILDLWTWLLVDARPVMSWWKPRAKYVEDTGITLCLSIFRWMIDVPMYVGDQIGDRGDDDHLHQHIIIIANLQSGESPFFVSLSYRYHQIYTLNALSRLAL